MTEENKDDTKKTVLDKFIVWGGAIALLVGLYLSFTNIYDRFYPNEPHIVATGVTYQLSKLPPLVVSETDIKKIVNDKLPIAAEIPDDQKLAQKQAVQDMIIETATKVAADNKVSGQWTIKVENRGKKKATDVRLKLPFDARYTIIPSITQSANPLTTSQLGTIELGDLHSSDLKSVVIWTADDTTAYSPAKEYRVTYAEGPATAIRFVQFARKEGVDMLSFVAGIVSVILATLAMTVAAASSLLRKLQESVKQEKNIIVNRAEAL